MKAFVKQASARGIKVTCESCHKDLGTFELIASARDDLAAILARLQNAP